VAKEALSQVPGALLHFCAGTEVSPSQTGPWWGGYYSPQSSWSFDYSCGTMEVGASGLVLLEIEVSHWCHLEIVLSTGQILPMVEEMREWHEEGEGVGGIAGRSHFRVAPVRKKGEKQYGWSRRLSVGGRTRRRTISGLGFLSRWREG
jgi:hypothetical protein